LNLTLLIVLYCFGNVLIYCLIEPDYFCCPTRKAFWIASSP
jgi:hypothetical protein